METDEKFNEIMVYLKNQMSLLSRIEAGKITLSKTYQDALNNYNEVNQSLCQVWNTHENLFHEVERKIKLEAELQQNNAQVIEKKIQEKISSTLESHSKISNNFEASKNKTFNNFQNINLKFDENIIDAEIESAKKENEILVNEVEEKEKEKMDIMERRLQVDSECAKTLATYLTNVNPTVKDSDMIKLQNQNSEVEKNIIFLTDLIAKQKAQLEI